MGRYAREVVKQGGREVGRLGSGEVGRWGGGEVGGRRGEVGRQGSWQAGRQAGRGGQPAAEPRGARRRPAAGDLVWGSVFSQAGSSGTPPGVREPSQSPVKASPPRRSLVRVACSMGSPPAGESSRGTACDASQQQRSGSNVHLHDPSRASTTSTDSTRTCA